MGIVPLETKVKTFIFSSNFAVIILFCVPHSASEEDVLKSQQSIRSQALGNQNFESETLLDGDEDTLSSLDDKELDNVTGDSPFTGLIFVIQQKLLDQNV